MKTSWLILTSRYGKDTVSPSAEDLREGVCESFEEYLPGMTEADFREHGSAHLRYGFDEGPMFILEISRNGSICFEQWADQDFEQELSPGVSRSVSKSLALELFSLLAAGDIDQLKAIFQGRA